MKILYDSFEELSRHFRDGNSVTHKFSDHTDSDCMAWQQGVREFARYLDEKGYGIVLKEDPVTPEAVREERERAERIGRAILAMPDGTELRRNIGGGWKYIDPSGVDYGYYEAIEDAICVQTWKPRWKDDRR